MRRYRTFEEVDKDLKILQLQSEINKEELKLNLSETKESLSPSKLITGLVGSLTTSAILLKLLTPIIGFAINRYLRRKS
ncbi:DUF6327 family protein [Ulvibacter antarcticus]|uniref:Uncharacterized protein n=1 Tax=Ulvibacter antarcticus TaxID=442714 RepID=A0A3L9Z6W6_9FLAO|nr:DUF6327 family protein [Ulvibacter antarcticus]RMA66015.1 hypothetical protein BXY75_0431 [Ulvibacter antarcticus]